jgi:hypothetical protein
MSIRFGADTPMGLRPYDVVYRINRYRVDTTAAQIFPGDAVTRLASGGLALLTTATQIPIGVSAEWTTASQASASLLVYDHPDQLFVIQDDADTSFMTSARIGENFDLVYTAGTTTAGPASLRELDVSTGDVAGAGVSTVVRALKIHEGEASVRSTGSQIGDQVYATTGVSGSQKKVVVSFVTHAFTNATTV